MSRTKTIPATRALAPVAPRGAQVVYVEKIVERKPARKQHHRQSSGGSIVTDPGSGDPTTRAGAHLTAKVPGHVVVSFEGPAIGAMLSGFFRQLEYGNTNQLTQLFPDLYPDHAAALNGQKWGTERAMGAEEAKMLGAALRAYGVTLEQWGAWYAKAIANAPPLPQAAPTAGPFNGAGGGGDGAWGPVLGVSSQVTGAFGEQRGP